MATTEKLKDLTDLLRSYTTEQLLALKANRVPGSENFLVVEREIQRRKQLDQQEGRPKSASLTAELRHKPT
jgi:hypothetical protein